MSQNIERADHQQEAEHQKKLLQLLKLTGKILKKHHLERLQDTNYDHVCRINSGEKPLEIASDKDWLTDDVITPYSRIVFNNIVIHHNGKRRMANVALTKRGDSVILEPGEFKEFLIETAIIEETVSKTLDAFRQHYDQQKSPFLGTFIKRLRKKFET